MYLMRMNQTMKLLHTMHKVRRVGADTNVKDSADCASSVHVSEEDVLVEFELAETLPVKDCSSDFNVNISDDKDSTAVECANQNMRAISKR
jgi:hypothetical protein